MSDLHTHLQLVVDYKDDTTRYYPVPHDQGWRIDPTYRQLVVGKGVPRVHVPLDSVLCFEPKTYTCKDESCPISRSTASQERWLTGNRSMPARSQLSTDPFPSAPTSGSSDKNTSLKTEWGTVLTSTSGYQAALQRIGLVDITQWSTLPTAQKFVVLGYLVYHGHVISSSPGPRIENHPANDPSCPQCTQSQP